MTFVSFFLLIVKNQFIFLNSVKFDFLFFSDENLQDEPT